MDETFLLKKITKLFLPSVGEIKHLYSIDQSAYLVHLCTFSCNVRCYKNIFVHNSHVVSARLSKCDMDFFTFRFHSSYSFHLESCFVCWMKSASLPIAEIIHRHQYKAIKKCFSLVQCHGILFTTVEYHLDPSIRI